MVKQVNLKGIQGFKPVPIKVIKLHDDLIKLDVQYLTGYPIKIIRSIYLKKRDILRRRFNKLKEMYK